MTKNSGNRGTRLLAALFLLAPILPAPAHAQFSVTELHIQYGTLDVPSFFGGGEATHLIYTLQHSSGWEYGDNFFFIDVLDSRRPGFQDFDLYGQWYANFSLGKLAGREIGGGPITDVGVIGGFNWAADANVKKYLPGVRLSLGIGGFAFANLDVMAYIDGSEGADSEGAPAETNSFLVDFNFARPFRIGTARFSVEGHMQYGGRRENEFGDEVEPWILAQPQLRWYLGDRIAIGIEYQYWMNKLGDAATDERAVQALVVWRF